MKEIYIKSSLRKRISVVIGMVVALIAFSATIAAAVPYQVGDVFAGVGHGQIRHYDKNGNFIENLIVPDTGYTEAGMAFDSNNNLYSTLFSINKVAKFDGAGNFIGFFGSGYNNDPESILFDASGNSYVGQANGTHHVLKFDSSENLIGTFAPNVGPRGTDWIDLAKDQCTLYYTSEGQFVKRFDVCTNTQLPDFNTVPFPSSGVQDVAYALRILPDGGVLVADAHAVNRLDSMGNIVKTYPSPTGGILFALNRDPDGTSFWTGDLMGGKMFKIDIASGNILLTIDTKANGNFDVLGGITVFGEQTEALGSIEGVKFGDINNNGVKDTGEPSLSGWTITLTKPDGSTVSTTTDASGRYIFDNLLIGTYTVSETLQSGWTQTAPAGGTYTLAISAGDHEKDKDFGNFQLGSISGIKFNDLDGDGMKDAGEPGLGGWTITLKKPDGTTVTTTTDGSGNYVFGALSAGTYTVGEVLQPGWIQTAPAESATGSATHMVTISTSGQNVPNQDFGNFKLAVVLGMKWEDLNANGMKDSFETGLSGWQINIKGTDTITGEAVDITTTTDANGNYGFTNLTAGTYAISEKLQDGWVQTWPTTGDYTVTITSGDVIKGLDFGNFLKGKITGGGYIPATGGEKASFGLTGQYLKDDNMPHGDLEYQDQVAGLNVKSIQINTVAVSNDKMKGAITGLAQVNGKGSYYFEVYVEDNGEPGGGVDVFKISLPTYPYSNGGNLISGNIQIHK